MSSDHGRSKLRTAFYTLIVFSVLTSVLLAQDTRSQNKFFWWRSEDVRKKLELTNDQVEKIEKIFQEFKEQIYILRDELETKENELKKLLQSPEVSREQVLDLTNEVEQVKAKARMMKMDMLLDIREVLTSEQRSTLQRIKHEYNKGAPKNMYFPAVKIVLVLSV